MASDGDNGIDLGLITVFPEGSRPRQVACSHHRGANIAKHGRDCTNVFNKLMLAPTVEKVAEIKISSFYIQLLATARDSLCSVPDYCQFPASVVANGARVYGKSASQAVESNNRGIMPGRCLDVVSSICGNVNERNECILRNATRRTHVRHRSPQGLRRE